MPFLPTVEHEHDLQNFDFTFTSEHVTKRGVTQSTQGLDLNVEIKDDSQRLFDNFTCVAERVAERAVIALRCCGACH